MLTGISSACFYPLETEKSVARCGELGFSNIEIFVNTMSELEGQLQRKIVDEVRYYGLDVCSVHPFTSFAESFMIFGNYERRVEDTLEFYKRFFDFANKVGAKILILHGGHTEHTVDNEEYFERYARLYSVGKSFGVTVSHENVVKYRAQSPLFMKKMSDYLGNDFAMTLDIKQCRRAGEKPEDFVRFVGEKIVNVHISDCNSESDCVVPFKGDFDFPALQKELKEKKFNGKYLIELYSCNFKNDADLAEAAKKFDSIIL